MSNLRLKESLATGDRLIDVIIVSVNKWPRTIETYGFLSW